MLEKHSHTMQRMIIEQTEEVQTFQFIYLAGEKIEVELFVSLVVNSQTTLLVKRQYMETHTG